jgi:hypothetical protein
MDVKMVDYLTPIGPGIDHCAEFFPQSFAARNPGGNQMKIAQHFLVFGSGFCHRPNVFTRHH